MQVFRKSVDFFQSEIEIHLKIIQICLLHSLEELRQRFSRIDSAHIQQVEILHRVSEKDEFISTVSE